MSVYTIDNMIKEKGKRKERESLEIKKIRIMSFNNKSEDKHYDE